MSHDRKNDTSIPGVFPSLARRFAPHWSSLRKMARPLAVEPLEGRLLLSRVLGSPDLPIALMVGEDPLSPHQAGKKTADVPSGGVVVNETGSVAPSKGALSEESTPAVGGTPMELGTTSSLVDSQRGYPIPPASGPVLAGDVVAQLLPVPVLLPVTEPALTLASTATSSPIPSASTAASATLVALDTASEVGAATFAVIASTRPAASAAAVPIAASDPAASFVAHSDAAPALAPAPPLVSAPSLVAAPNPVAIEAPASVAAPTLGAAPAPAVMPIPSLLPVTSPAPATVAAPVPVLPRVPPATPEFASAPVPAPSSLVITASDPEPALVAASAPFATPDPAEVTVAALSAVAVPDPESALVVAPALLTPAITGFEPARAVVARTDPAGVAGGMSAALTLLESAASFPAFGTSGTTEAAAANMPGPIISQGPISPTESSVTADAMGAVAAIVSIGNPPAGTNAVLTIAPGAPAGPATTGDGVANTHEGTASAPFIAPKGPAGPAPTTGDGTGASSASLRLTSSAPFASDSTAESAASTGQVAADVTAIAEIPVLQAMAGDGRGDDHGLTPALDGAPALSHRSVMPENVPTFNSVRAEVTRSLSSPAPADIVDEAISELVWPDIDPAASGQSMHAVLSGDDQPLGDAGGLTRWWESPCDWLDDLVRSEVAWANEIAHRLAPFACAAGLCLAVGTSLHSSSALREEDEELTSTRAC